MTSTGPSSIEVENLVNSIIDAANSVYIHLGKGHTESIYHAALELELRYRNINYQREVIVPIMYKQHSIGHVRVDLIVDDRVLVELKALSSDIRWQEHNQILAYLRSQSSCIPRSISHGLLLNFSQHVNKHVDAVEHYVCLRSSESIIT